MRANLFKIKVAKFDFTLLYKNFTKFYTVLKTF
nr:MAG TPA: hypothetical protein [Caudoviricetes sp.]